MYATPPPGSVVKKLIRIGLDGRTIEASNLANLVLLPCAKTTAVAITDSIT
jgi:hypothetical protein